MTSAAIKPANTWERREFPATLTPAKLTKDKAAWINNTCGIKKGEYRVSWCSATAQFQLLVAAQLSGMWIWLTVYTSALMLLKRQQLIMHFLEKQLLQPLTYLLNCARAYCIVDSSIIHFLHALSKSSRRNYIWLKWNIREPSFSWEINSCSTGFLKTTSFMCPKMKNSRIHTASAHGHKNKKENWRRDANKGPARVKDALLFKRAADRSWILTNPPFSELLKEQLCCLRGPDGPAPCDQTMTHMQNLQSDLYSGQTLSLLLLPALPFSFLHFAEGSVRSVWAPAVYPSSGE